MDDPTEILIDLFNGGISDDIREQTKSQFALTKHFDIFSNPHRLSPYRSFEDDTNDGVSSTDLKQYEVSEFLFSQVSGRLYGIGKQASFSRAKIFYKTDPSQGNWTLPATAEAGAGLQHGSFIEWASAIWFFQGSTQIGKWAIDSTVTDTVASVGGVGASPSIISPFDNNMYMFYSNKVVRVTSGGSVTDDVVPLPTGYTIKGACLYENAYLAIAMNLGGTSGKSIVVLWDPTLSNFSEVIDFGDGEIRAIANLEGQIVALMDVSMSTSYSFAGGKLTIKHYAGGAVETTKELKLTGLVSSGLFLQRCLVKDGKVYFVAEIVYNGATSRGIFGYGRKNINAPYALTLALVDENASSIQGFGNVGDYWFLCENGDGSVRKSDDQANYTITSTMESQKYNGGDIAMRKKLHSVLATYAPLPAAGQVVLKYRKDEETSYTTLFTETTDNAMATNMANGAAITLPEFKEIQFKIESTGGAEITSWGFRFFPLADGARPE